ncbi:binding-protein-dependent transport systems inner membrane component [Shewanella denitrificans OS217]|uniref:Binding-protein-dependent transport systems inner membrane component n=1 Tax=Shewanella denitrificans (strain OS217 / ATCC BAA-1090 / DSM 15013) TaxID=318161 RepID=Q12LB3_SHEDO|nr:ABC transporter permease [Shewanella denitrificans]ABE55763.1 binding-protein-dependent transport systems inner membrane component [Shewanella denitrificans OS217]
MWRYLIRRMVLFFATSLVMMAVLFIATSLFPVEKSYSLSGIEFPTPQQHEQLTQIYQLDNNLFSQFTAYLRERLSGNLGISSNSQQSVADELMSVLPASLELSLFAGALALFFGVPLGVIAALTKNKLIETSILALTLTGYSVPVFWLGLTLSLWFGVNLGWLPIAGQINLLYEIEPVTGLMLIDTLLSDSVFAMAAFEDALLHIILPGVTLAVLPFTTVIRITRQALQDVMTQTYIQAAEARGLSSTKILLRHALPNAFIPVLKSFGLMLGSFASYAIVVEVIFAWPGVGAWLVSGIYQRDYTVIQGGILSVSLLIIFLSIIIDLIYTAINPMSKKELYAAH